MKRILSACSDHAAIKKYIPLLFLPASVLLSYTVNAGTISNKHKPPASGDVYHPLKNKYTADTLITGTITNQTGTPVSGASVTVQGTTSGTVTDTTGYFQINVPSNATLVISSVGFQPQTIPVANQT